MAKQGPRQAGSGVLCSRPFIQGLSKIGEVEEGQSFGGGGERVVLSTILFEHIIAEADAVHPRGASRKAFGYQMSIINT